MNDTRNVTDEFKDVPHDEIVAMLNDRGISLEIAIENTLRDFNMGTIVRSANAFGIRRVHVIGRRQWNKRGAMATDKYLEIEYHTSATAFAEAMHLRGKKIYAIDNVETAQPLNSVAMGPDSVLVFGQEGPGLSEELLEISEAIIAIEQRGSTRSLNVGVAAGIAMYEWTRQNVLQEPRSH